MSDLSLHIDCTYRWDDIKLFLASSHVHSAFLMNASAEQVQYALDHCDFVVVRVYDPFNERNSLGEDFEKSIVNRRSGSEFVNWLDNSPFAQFKHNKKVRFVLGWNELYSKRGIAEREQNTRIVAIAQALVDAGYGVGVGAWAADKSFYADDVNAAHWDNVIRFAVQNKDMVSIDCHEYDVLTPFAGHLASYPDGFPNTLKSAISLDSANHGIIPYTRAQGNIESNYKIGRIALLLQRALDITGDVFNWYRGECAHDFKDDGILKQFIDDWYKPQFGQPTGINSLLPFYRHVLGNVNETDYDVLIFKQYVDLVDRDPDSCQANFIFAWNGSTQWAPFNVALRPHFVSLVATFDSQSQEPQPMPESQYNDYDVPMKAYMAHTTKSIWNIRNQPRTDGDDIGDMPTTPTQAQVSVAPVHSDSTYDWYKIDVNGIQGFTAQLRGESIPNVFTPIVADEPEPPTDEQWQQLRDEIIEVKTKFAALEAQINRELEMVHIDVPYAGGIFTYSVPRFALKTEIARSKGLGEWQQQNEDALRRADGQILLKDIDPDIFASQSHVTAEPDIDINTNFAVDDSIDATFDEQGNLSIALGIGNEELLENMERTITDIILNEDTDDAEDGKPAA